MTPQNVHSEASFDRSRNSMLSDSKGIQVGVYTSILPNSYEVIHPKLSTIDNKRKSMTVKKAKPGKTPHIAKGRFKIKGSINIIKVIN